MATFIPSIPYSEFIKLRGKVKELKSCEVTYNDEYLFTAIIIPPNSGMTITDAIKTDAEYLANRANTVGGKTLEELKDASVSV